MQITCAPFSRERAAPSHRGAVLQILSRESGRRQSGKAPLVGGCPGRRDDLPRAFARTFVEKNRPCALRQGALSGMRPRINAAQVRKQTSGGYTPCCWV